MNVTARWPVLDLYKFLLALLLIVAHYTSEYAPLPGLFDTLTTLYIVAVPFYLTCSSFLFFSKEGRVHPALSAKNPHDVRGLVHHLFCVCCGRLGGAWRDNKKSLFLSA